ncbi:hypothetical protein A2Z33_00785 [Candidatus Gottesmanbacteria bacterium RBG_16_52_11]|uniref:Solute-binding protein family 5 domain-containing protein n=1 Tax=Candidatus Gottesmanbacteria bacterium RBG_16_52_11 TaxID=1798374 RepID=A0A1F5YP91_9BACT|nr:MAG: hypothetical protein A2Z33_00785 [Candidatus Gottesmanbacteria bacterium RBG_16_52_11]
MTLIRRWRVVYWIIRDIAVRYTRFLILGFLIGLGVMLASGRLLPLVRARWLVPVERIGLVGEFTPSSLPSGIQSLISIGLTTLDEDGSVHPGLATWWEATDSGKRYIFHLDDDASWHNGRRFTSHDVNYNINNVVITPIDEMNVSVSLENPYSPLPALLSKPLFRNGLVGLGPYKVDKLQLNGDRIRSIRLIPIKSNTTATVRQYTFYQTEAAAIMGYKQGEVDILEDITNPTELVNWSNTEISERINYSRIITLFFNVRSEFLSDRTNRQALAFGLPEFAETAALSPISLKSWAYSDDVKQYESNTEQARKVFKEFRTGTASAEIILSTFPSYLDIAQAIADSWTGLGLTTGVKVENEVSTQYMALLSAIDVPPDPDQYVFWHSTQTATNITGYSNAKIDKLLEDGRQEMNPETRKNIYADFSRRLVDDAPALFLYYAKTYTISRS